jgi:hypothetical protein
VQCVVGRPEDEVDDLGGCVDDPQRLGSAGKPDTEELLLELDDDALFAFGVVDTGRASAPTRRSLPAVRFPIPALGHAVGGLPASGQRE